MKTNPAKIAIIAAIVFFGLLPVLSFELYVDRMPHMSAAKAKQIQADKNSHALLVDVREPFEYEQRHLEGAVNWPDTDIQMLGSKDGVPEELRGKRILLLCDTGLISPNSVRHLRRLGVTNALFVRGGIEEWTSTFAQPCPLQFCRLKTAGGKLEDLPFRTSTPFEQWALVIISFGVKPLYIMISLALLAVGWRLKSSDLLAVRWALLAFFIGETICAVNYLLFTNASYLLEYLHNYGMVLSFGFITFALLEGLDLRVLKYSDPEKKCAGLDLCRTCIKYTEAPCGFQRMFLFLAPACAIFSLIPLTTTLGEDSYNSMIWGQTYNFMESVTFQIYELYVCPGLAALFFAACGLVLWLRKENPVPAAKILFAMGTGFLAFGLFRMTLFFSFRDNLLWFDNWEEITELIYMCAIAATLWIFRKNIFEQRKQTHDSAN